MKKELENKMMEEDKAQNRGMVAWVGVGKEGKEEVNRTVSFS